MNHLLVASAAVLLLALVAAPFIILRRRKPAAPVQPPKPDGWDDLGYAHAHGIPLNIWATLTPEKKAELRLTAAHALRKN